MKKGKVRFVYNIPHAGNGKFLGFLGCGMTAALGLIQDPALLLRQCGFTCSGLLHVCYVGQYDRLCMRKACGYDKSVTHNCCTVEAQSQYT